MKKNAFFLVLSIFTLLCPALRASNLEVRAGGFIPTSKTFRQVYGDVLPEIQLQASVPLVQCWNLWGSVSYINKSGKSTPLKDRSKLSLVPISIGIKYSHMFCSCWNIYGGVGLTYQPLFEKTKCNSCTKHHHRDGCGAIFKLGIETALHCLTFGVYSDYRYQELYNHHCINTSGFSFGASLGYNF